VHVRRVVTLGFAVVVVGLAMWSFYTAVLDPHRDGQAMEGMVAADNSTSQPGSVSDETAGTDGKAVPVPPLLGGLQLTALQSGEEGLLAVEQLHGKALGAGLGAAWVAHYGNAGEATVWVSRSVAQADARALFARMTDTIGKGNSPFSGLTPIVDTALEGYELDGMGQKHFYFLAGTDLYWLAVNPELARSALADLTEKVLSTPAGVN
jgi:hypothetical protein